MEHREELQADGKKTQRGGAAKKDILLKNSSHPLDWEASYAEEASLSFLPLSIQSYCLRTLGRHNVAKTQSIHSFAYTLVSRTHVKHC